MKPPPAQHRAWAARAALAAARNDQPAFDLLIEQVKAGDKYALGDLLVALAYELSSFYVETGLVDKLALYAEDVTALALNEDGGNGA